MDDTTEVAEYDGDKFRLTVQDIRDFTERATVIARSAASAANSAASIANAAALVWQSDARYAAMCQHIAARKEIFHEFLSKTFDGRDKAIDALIGQIENGVNQNNTALLLKAMDGLTTIVASNPWPNFDVLNKMINSGEEIIFE
jgi:hypothetical protein